MSEAVPETVTQSFPCVRNAWNESFKIIQLQIWWSGAIRLVKAHNVFGIISHCFRSSAAFYWSFGAVEWAPPHFCRGGGGGGLSLQPNFRKGGGLDRTSTFRGGLLGKKEGVTFFTRFLLEHAIISSKTNPCSGSTKQKRINGYVRNNKTMSAILSFISTLYLKQQTNILWCFSSLKFENSLLSSKLLRCIFRSGRKFYAAENDQIKYFVRN